MLPFTVSIQVNEDDELETNVEITELEVGGAEDDVQLEDVSAYLPGSNEPIDDSDLLYKIIDVIERHHQDILYDEWYDNQVGAAEARYDSLMDR